MASLQIYDPFVDPAVETLFRNFLRPERTDRAAPQGIRIDVAETDKEVTIRAEVPGIDPKEINVSVTGDQLVISGEKKEKTERKGNGFSHHETRYGSFHRAIPLPEGVDSEKVDAQYANGVLTLTLAKSPQAAPKRIEIKVKD